ncbi:MAG: hypothetical protein RR258_07420, partial [Alistipes sp.]
ACREVAKVISTVPLRPLDKLEDREEFRQLRPLDRLEDREELRTLSLRPLDKLEDREQFQFVSSTNLPTNKNDSLSR